MHNKNLGLNFAAQTQITIASGVSLLSLLFVGIHSARAQSTTLDIATPIDQTQVPEKASGMSQVTNLNQLTDVQPTDWAFQALQSLVERYGCIAGYPNSTFRGSRAMTRYEFAAGLNACLNRVNELIATRTTDLVTKQDLATLQKLQTQFSAELVSLRGRVDTLEARTATIEAQQFSPTSKLGGQFILSVNAGAFSGPRIIPAPSRSVPPPPGGPSSAGGNPIGAPQNTLPTSRNPNPTVLYRTGIDIDTSFQGTDLLKIRLETGSGIPTDNRAELPQNNASSVLEPNFGSSLDYSIKPPTNRVLGIGRLFYAFKPTRNLQVSVGPDIRTTDYADRNTYAYLSFLDFSTQAFVNNLILFPVDGPTAGAAVDWKPNNGAFSVRAVYAAADAANPVNQGPIRSTSTFTKVLYSALNSDPNSTIPGSRHGLFGNTYQGTVELEYAPTRAFAVRLEYSGGEILAKRFDVIGVNAELTLAKRFGIFGRYGAGSYNRTDFGDVKPNYWMAGVAMRDLFTRGSLAGVAVGQPFIASQIGNSTQTNFEAFYNYPFSRNIQVTPTIQVIQHAGNQDSNGTIVTGTLRTVFSF